jgi:predicted RNase H-like HicB family nuclease
MNEIIFLIEESAEGGYSARAMGYSIFTESDSIEEIKENIKDALKCHFADDDLPKLVRMHFVKDEVFALT